jgi:hypothetical protein
MKPLFQRIRQAQRSDGLRARADTPSAEALALAERRRMVAGGNPQSERRRAGFEAAPAQKFSPGAARKLCVPKTPLRLVAVPVHQAFVDVLDNANDADVIDMVESVPAVQALRALGWTPPDKS